MNNQPLYSKPRTVNWILGAGILLAFLLFGVLLVWGFILPATKSISLSTNTTPISVTPTPTQIPVSGSNFLPEYQARKVINSSLGGSNREVPRLISLQWNESDQTLTIQWTLNSDVSKDLILVEGLKDIKYMLKAIVAQGIPYDYQNIIFDGSYPIINSSGHYSEQRLILATINRDKLQNIDWENLLPEDIAALSSNIYIDPAYK